MRRCSCPNSLHHTLENHIVFVLILAVALMSVAQGAHAQIAFSSDRGGDFDIYVMDQDGSNVIQLTNHPDVDANPVWSPDGRRIAFSSLRDEPPNTHGNSEIYIMDANGGNVIRLTNQPRVDGTPTWSPDGKQIAFASREGKNLAWEIFRIDVDGSGIKNLTNNSANDQYPAWSPNGEKIAFASDRDGDYDIYVMNPDGNDVLRLTDHPAYDFTPSWFPGTLAVSPRGKLPTQWSAIKSKR